MEKDNHSMLALLLGITLGAVGAIFYTKNEEKIKQTVNDGMNKALQTSSNTLDKAKNKVEELSTSTSKIMGQKIQQGQESIADIADKVAENVHEATNIVKAETDVFASKIDAKTSEMAHKARENIRR